MLLAAPLPPCLAATADGLPGPGLIDAEDAQVLYLQVTLNQTDTGTLARFSQVRGRLQATVETLRGIGFILAGRAPQEVVDLEALPGVSVRYQADLQRVRFDAPLSELSLDTTVLRPQEEVAPEASASPGTLLNYELFASRDRELSNLTTSTEWRAFGFGPGVLSNSSVLRLYRDRDSAGWRSAPVRLDTSWRLDLPARAVTAEVGDFYSDHLQWSRSVRMAGIQIGRNYGLQPYRVTMPLPSFVGQATVPSTIELYVDGLRQYSGQVAAGPFQLSTLPGVNGNGTAQIVVTDAFGQVRTLDFSFYGTQRLLAKGLSEGGAGLGVLRRDYGLRSFGYDHAPVATGTLRYGVSDSFTAETHGEAGAGLTNVGTGGTWLLGSAGLLSAAYARSRLHQDDGGQYAVEYSWNSHRYNVSAGTQRSQGAYRDIGALQNNLPARASDHVVAGVSLPRAGAFSASYVLLRADDAGSSRYASAFWSQSFGRRWSANLSVNQNLDRSADRSMSLSLSISLDTLRRGALSVQHSAGRTSFVADASRAMPGSGGPDGIGWRLQARTGQDGRDGLGEVGWQNDIGRYMFGIASQGGADYAYGSARGSLAWLGGGVLAARAVDGAFAVIETGLPEIPVRLENRMIGRTNARGQLLVTPLQPWQRNHVAIDTLDLPADLRIDAVERLMTPRAGTGVRVRFDIDDSLAAILILQEPSGAALPVGTIVSLDGAPSAQPSMVGHDGEAYLEGLQAHNQISVDGPQGRCRLAFNLDPDATHATRIGPLTCSPGGAL